MNLSFSVTEALNNSFIEEYNKVVVKTVQEGGRVMSQSAFFEMLLKFWVEQNGWSTIEAHNAIERLNKEIEVLNKKEEIL